MSNRRPLWPLISLAATLLSAVTIAACGGASERAESAVIAIDGSSTVFPISQAVAEDFQRENPAIRVTVAESGTGGGFQKFCRNETAISDASRPVKATEAELCAGAGISYVELPVAYDGLAVVVSHSNTWVNSMTVEELHKLWEPAAQGQIKRWNQIRADWPDAEIHLFGPGTASGTFDYFTEAINGKAQESRGDYTASEDDNVLVQGIAGDPNALGYFGLAYFEQNQDKLKLVPVDDGNPDNGAGPIAPSIETVRNGTYRPLSRPLFIYANTKALERPEVQKFVEFYMKLDDALIREVGYVPLAPAEQDLVRKRWAARTTGSMFTNASHTASLEDLLKGMH
ncbi:MAG: PstS family phosphate ABC transporter substrate-binding protein [Vicinamibacterales bacterium]